MRPSDLTPAMIASSMGVSAREAFFIARNPEQSYYPTDQRKDHKGRERRIDPPKPRPKALFRRLHRFWENNFPPHGKAHGGVRRRSCFTSARQHLGKKYVETRDVSDCYPSIHTDALRRALLRKGFRADTAWLVSRLSTVHGRLPLGCPLSSDALNIYLAGADNRIASFCGRRGASYSRVYDDFIISHSDAALKGLAGAALERSIEEHGLDVNERKRRKVGLQPNSGLQLVHGVIVNSKRGTRVNADQWRSALAAAERYRRSARAVNPDTLEVVVKRRERTAGWMHHCRQAEHSPAREVRRLLEAGDRIVERKLAQTGLAAHRKKWWVSSRGRNPRWLAGLWRKRLATRSGGMPGGSSAGPRNDHKP